MKTKFAKSNFLHICAFPFYSALLLLIPMLSFSSWLEVPNFSACLHPPAPTQHTQLPGLAKK